MKKISLVSSIILSFIFVFYWCHARVDSSQHADLVIFSYNRPLQLYALLESIEKHISGLHEIHVIYRADDPYISAYKEVFLAYSTVISHHQSVQPNNFRDLTFQASFASPTPYILFAVDDIVVKEDINCTQCIQYLERENAYGFFLRLGTHLSECYPLRCKQPLPHLQEVEPNVFKWMFSQATLDWAYPHTVDMTLYRKKDIESQLRSISFHNPNRLEGAWHSFTRSKLSCSGLCFKNAKIVNLPLNRVQNDFNNRAMNEISPSDLLKIFNDKKKIDIAPLATIVNNAAHMEYTPSFITRVGYG